MGMKEPLRRPTLRAQQLRREATPAERRLWQSLNKSQLGGFKFSRQMPIGPFICDFLCRSENLAIELDGESHDTSQDADAARDRYIATQGIRILRFTNADVFDNLEGVLITIEQALRSGPPLAPPAGGRGIT